MDSDNYLKNDLISHLVVFVHFKKKIQKTTSKNSWLEIMSLKAQE